MPQNLYDVLVGGVIAVCAMVSGHYLILWDNVRKQKAIQRNARAVLEPRLEEIEKRSSTRRK